VMAGSPGELQFRVIPSTGRRCPSRSPISTAPWLALHASRAALHDSGSVMGPNRPSITAYASAATLRWRRPTSPAFRSTDHVV